MKTIEEMFKNLIVEVSAQGSDGIEDHKEQVVLWCNVQQRMKEYGEMIVDAVEETVETCEDSAGNTMINWASIRIIKQRIQ